MSSLQIRTRDRRFDNIIHLIDYHRENRLPITSAESSIRLLRPLVA